MKKLISLAAMMVILLLTSQYAFSSEAEIWYPAQGSTLEAKSSSFKWTDDPDVAFYTLYIGTSPGWGNLYVDKHSNRPGHSLRTQTNGAIGLPHDGSAIHVTLISYYRDSTGDYSNIRKYYTYTAHTSHTAKIISPVPGSELNSTSVTFTWNNTAVPTGYYRLAIGSTINGTDYCEEYIDPPTVTSVTVDNLPDDGSDIYVSLQTFYWPLQPNIGGFRYYTYKAKGGCSSCPTQQDTQGVQIGGVPEEHFSCHENQCWQCVESFGGWGTLCTEWEVYP